MQSPLSTGVLAVAATGCSFELTEGSFAATLCFRCFAAAAGPKDTAESSPAATNMLMAALIPKFRNRFVPRRKIILSSIERTIQPTSAADFKFLQRLQQAREGT